jgi:hypothetical protein
MKNSGKVRVGLPFLGTTMPSGIRDAETADHGDDGRVCTQPPFRYSMLDTRSTRPPDT